MEYKHLTRINVLLVDDEEASYIFLRSLLQSVVVTEYFIEWVKEFEEAKKAIVKGHYDVIIVDYRLDERSGLDLLEYGKKKNINKPLIFLTGMEDEQIDIKAMSIGASDYLLKNELTSSLLDRSIRYAIENRRLIDEVEKSKEYLEEELSLTQAKLNQLTSWQEGSVTAELSGIGALRTRQPKEFKMLKDKYSDIIENYLDIISKNKKVKFTELDALANDLGDLGSGPKDVVDLHLHAIKEKSSNGSCGPKRLLAYTVEGRLALIELMGYLVDYYRIRG